MRRLAVAPIIIVIVFIGITQQAFSMGNRPPVKKKYFVEKYPRNSKAVGRVARVDTGRSEIVISTEEYKSVILKVDSKTKLLKDGKSVKLSDIKNGNAVRVDYEIVYKDKNIAQSIDVESGNMSEPKRKR